MIESVVGVVDRPRTRAFLEFHARHPEVEAALVLHARLTCRAGVRVTFGLLWGLLRMDGKRLDDAHRPFYARLLMADYPELAGLFVTRQSGEADDWAQAYRAVGGSCGAQIAGSGHGATR